MAGSASWNAPDQDSKALRSPRAPGQLLLPGVAVLGLLLAIGVSAAFAEEGDPAPHGGPTAAEVEEAIEDPGVRAVEIPHTDPQAAEELPHRDLSRDQANELLSSVFGPELQGSTGIFDELEVEKFYSDTAALIAARDQPNGEGGGPEEAQPTLLESSLPLRTEAPNGHEEAVDLDLEKAEGELQPTNPLVEVGIPLQLGDGFSLPESGVEIQLTGAPAELSPSLGDQSIATYPNVAEDTTLAVTPTPTGLEVLTLLQSADAPTSQTFNLTLPGGASLHETEDGGAEVRGSSETLVAIPPPSALDANGKPVQVRLEVVGSSISLVTEPGPESALPILVDPLFESYGWRQGTSAGAPPSYWWSKYSNSPEFHATDWGTCPGCPGLVTGLGLSTGIGWVTAGSQASWSYRVPRWATDFADPAVKVRPTTYIRNATLWNLYFDATSGAARPLTSDPFMAMYLWDENNGFVSIGHRYGTEGNLSDMNYLYNLTNPNEITGAKQLTLELVSTQNQQSQYRQLYVGSVTIELSDKDSPAFGSLDSPTQWVNEKSEAKIPFTVSDPGLGVSKFTIEQPGTSGPSRVVETKQGCTGMVSKPCPRTWKDSSFGMPQLAYDPSTMPQGEDWVKVFAHDPIEHKSSQSEVRIKVDHTAPSLAPLSGTLTEQAKIGTNASQYTLKYSASDGDHEAPTALSSFGSAGTGEGQMQRPIGIAVDGSGNIWVADRENNRVEKFDENGKFLMQFGTTGSANGQFKDPRGITIGPSGTIWVSDIGNKRVQAFNAQGEFIRAITYASFVEPYGLATGPGGVLWVSDPSAHRVFEFTEAGAFIRKVYGSSTNPTGESALNAPIGLATDPNGNLWVADNGYNLVLKFDPSGKYIFQFGATGTGNGQFRAPVGIAIAGSGNLLVTDDLNNRVQEFQPSGTYLRQFGSGGSGSGQLKEPRGIAIGSDNTAFVVDAGNRRIARWSHADLNPQSGVVSTEVKVDGQLVEPKYAPGCSTANCSINNREWTFNANAYPSGQHKVQVIATDGVGLETTKEVTITSDGTPPELIPAGGFFTGPGGWLEQKSYIAFATAKDPGGSGVISSALKIDGVTVKSGTQSCPSGGCQLAIGASINMSAYKGGAHLAELIATDGAGNIAKKVWTINVDPKGEIPAAEVTATLEAVEVASDESIVSPTSPPLEYVQGDDTWEPTLEQDGASLYTTGAPAETTMTDNPEDGFIVHTLEGSVNITPAALTSQATSTEVSSSVAAVSGNTASQVDTVVRPIYDGAMTFQDIRDKTAPENFSWQVQLGEDQYLTQVDDQHAEVYYDEEHPAFSISAMPAADAVGSTVPTTLEVTAPNIITLVVHHQAGNSAAGGASFVYPVIAGAGWEGGFQTTTVEMPPPENIEDAEGESDFELSAPEPATTADAEISPEEANRNDEITSGTSLILWRKSIAHRKFRWIQCEHMPDWPDTYSRIGGDCGNPFTNLEGIEDVAFSYGIRGDYYTAPGVFVKHRGSSTEHIECDKLYNAGNLDAQGIVEHRYFIDPARECKWYGHTKYGEPTIARNENGNSHHLTPFGEWLWGAGGRVGQGGWTHFAAGLALYIWTTDTGYVGHHRTTCIDC